MSEMIERAAKAIAAKYGWAEWALPMCRTDARAALAAIEEPTEAMIEAAFDAGGAVSLNQVIGIWRAMHKAMMEGK